MGRFNIVIEGIDGTGKTTLAHRLLLELPSAVLRNDSANKPQSRQELLLTLARARSNAQAPKVNIFDRHPAITEYCYRDQGGLNVDQVIQELDDCRIDLLICALRPLNTLKIKVRDDDPEDVAYNKHLGARLPEIFERYNVLMTQLQKHILTKNNSVYFELYNGWDNEDAYKLFVDRIILFAERGW
jgi:Cdc6-like AAA superfamily ATPase